MAANFLHGIETIEIDQGPRPITEVKTAVIGLVGIAPTGEAQKCILVRNDVDAAQFGKRLPGFNIPDSLEHIFAQGAGTVIVVNVFNVATHTTQVTDEQQTVTNGTLKLSAAPIGTVTLKTVAGDPSPYVAGTDYTLDEFGNFTVVPGKIPNATVIKFSFKKLNPSAVTSAHIVGAVDGSGNRTGIQALDLAFNQFGFKPKILIAPGYSSATTVAQGLLEAADRLRAITYLDATYGLTVNEVVATRGSSSNFFTSNKRAVLVYPYLKAYDEATNTDTVDFPYSAFIAGVTAATDNEFGYWYSPSNKEISSITGVERPISAGVNDANSDANTLNAAGIVSVFNSFGTGYRTWGNRNASWPTNTRPDNFISIVRIADVVHESLEQAGLQFSDRPINQALIDDLRESGNAFIRVLVGRGALLEGSQVTYDVADNTPEQLAAGNITFRIVFMGSTPAERITFKSILDISLFKNIK